MSVQCLLQVKACFPWGLGQSWDRQPAAGVGQQILPFEGFLEGQKGVASASKALPWKEVSGWWGRDRTHHLGPRDCLHMASSGLHVLTG